MTYQPITLATAAAGLRVFAGLDIRDLPAGAFHYEPFRCHRCHDLGWVSDWANWSPTWLWQRYRPVPRKACPDCTDTGFRKRHEGAE